MRAAYWCARSAVRRRSRTLAQHVRGASCDHNCHFLALAGQDPRAARPNDPLVLTFFDRIGSMFHPDAPLRLRNIQTWDLELIPEAYPKDIEFIVSAIRENCFADSEIFGDSAASLWLRCLCVPYQTYCPGQAPVATIAILPLMQKRRAGNQSVACCYFKRLGPGA